MTESYSEKKSQLEALQREVAQLESELKIAKHAQPPWRESGYYGFYHATTGLILGIAGALVSLIFNVVGSLAVGQHPLRLIQVYLTFPLGERALSPQFDTGMALAIGCCLYIGTGMILAVPFQMIMARFLPNGSLGQRLVLATVLGLLLWSVSFYLLLAWLQPLLFGGNWIVDGKLLPPWVGAATHLVFAWTLAVLAPWGAYVPYERQTEQGSSKETQV